MASIADRFKDKIFVAAFITAITIITALFLYQKVNGFPFNIYATINVIIIVVSSAMFAWRWKAISKRKRE